NRPRPPDAPPTPTQRVVTRNRRAVPGWIASLPDLRSDVPGRLAAMQKENDRNREPRPAEFPRVINRSLADESAPPTCDHTILAPRHPDEICRAKQNLPLRARAAPHQFPTVAKAVYL